MQRFIRGSIGALVGALFVGLCVADEPQGSPQVNDVKLRFAQASLRVAEAEFEQSQLANKKAPGSVTPSELRRLALQVEKQRLAVAEAGREQRLAVAEAGRAPAELPSSAKETEAAIRKALDEKTQFEFVETPLEKVVDFIVKKHKIQILLNGKALDDAGLGIDTPITRRLSNISLRSALRLTLRDLDLTWVIEDEVLQITTLDDAGQRLKPHVYDVTDLVATEGGADYDTLIDTITSIIGPSTWDEVGGPGSIAPFPLADPAHAVVISQTMEMHDQIAQFLADVRSLRAARKGKVDSKPGGEAAEAAPADPNAISLKIYRVAVPQAAPPRVNAKPDEKGEKPQENLQQYGLGGQSGVPNDRYLEELARAIPALVRPETWERAGGAGVLYALPADMNFTGHLLVRQTGEVHVQLQKFLKELQPHGTAGGGMGGGFF